MEEDDAPILRYLYRALRPRRHLEFGTWQGAGTLLCLESCEAAVWTINLPEGEAAPEGADGSWSYYSDFAADDVPAWHSGRAARSGRVLCQTDARGFIGRRYLEAGLGHRVCQVYCDSRAWDASAYPPGFFDTALIDGGHSAEVVASDTRKALPLVRSGGVVLWHDFCLDAEVREQCASVGSVTAAVEALLPEVGPALRDVFWIEPSWVLVGVKR